MSRKDLAAGAAVFLVLVQLLLAQLTIAITGCLLIIGRVSRWRLTWLTWPAAGGILWVLADGLRPSLAGYLASGGHLIAHLAGSRSRAFGLARLRGALVGWRGWLSAQLPLALPVAVAESALIGLARRRDGRVQPRPGVLAVIRRAYLAWATGRGELATADGGCVGIALSTGRRAAVSWREAAGGVLCTGRESASVTETGLALMLAAIAHRKAVLAIDLASGTPEAGRTGLADVIESACADAGAPLRRFGGPHGCYDPFAGSLSWPASAPNSGERGSGERGSGERGAGDHSAGERGSGEHGAGRPVLAMIDWAGMGGERRRFCSEVVDAAMTVLTRSAAAAPDRPAPSMLDELIGLLRPGALGARARELPGAPGTVIELAGRLDAEPATVAPILTQLEELRGGPLGRWLRRASGDSRISLRRALANREVVLFSLDAARNGWPAAMIARLALADVTAILTELAELGEPTDCLVWVNGCDLVTPSQLRALVGVGASAGAAVLFGTSAESAAVALAADVNVVAIRGDAPPSLREVLGDRGPGHWGETESWEAQSQELPCPLWPAPQAGELAGSQRFGGATSRGAVLGGRPPRTPRVQSEWPESVGQPGSPERFPCRMKEDSALVPVPLAAGQHRDALSLLVRGPSPRVLTGCRAVR